jgi:hypothetical protein
LYHISHQTGDVNISCLNYQTGDVNICGTNNTCDNISVALDRMGAVNASTTVRRKFCVELNPDTTMGASSMHLPDIRSFNLF